MDTNPPDDQSWWFNAAEVAVPHGWEFWSQPAGDSPEAENIENLPHDYYGRIKAGKTEDWIKVYVKGEYGFIIDGKPVYPMYRDSYHAAKSVIEPIKAFPLWLGADFGLTPASPIAQKLPDGRWNIIDEFVSDDCGIIRFSESLVKYMAQRYPDHMVMLPKGFLSQKNEDVEMIRGWGDPAGNQRGGNDEKTAIEILREYTSWKWLPAPTNDWTMRREVVVAALNRNVDGQPGLLLSPNCKVLRKGFSSGYHYKFIKTGNGTTVHEHPAKNMYSHVHEGLQYLFLGGGEAQVVMNKVHRGKRKRGPIVMKDVDYPVFSNS